MHGKSAARPRSAIITGALVVAVSGLVGCGGSDESASDTATTAAKKAPSAAVADQFQGTWTRRFTGRQIKHMRSDLEPGTFTMVIGSGGSVEMYYPGATTADDCLTQFKCETFEVTGTGEKLTIGRTSLCTGTGEYSFVVTGDELSTKKIADDCFSDRPRLFDGRTWRRQS